MAKNKGQGRTRSWTCVVYPESAPANWRDIIDDLHIEWIESPLHDKDINADGEIKKSHWHLLFLFNSVKSYEQVLEITESVNATIPQKAQSAKGLVRYMIHLDNPEKYQYDKKDIIGHGGADVAELLKPNSSDRYALIKEMAIFIKDNNVVEFTELFDYALSQRYDDWFPLLCDNSAYVLGQYIKSNRYQLNKEHKDNKDIR
ncbi:replication protein [Tetragenococcus muriaticus]|uniref:Replication protein n=1 Tax=Tetragenococcus muriaticus 3MR10-3 TaxID=1302648 RepID=A0A091BW94_9ENTE|nr:replication protein [Tetragenococcus muriaticus]KFN89009.1 replication protein [Tetragenococcus muriaticus 3MR10-3]